jgi:hypothetical protein
MAFQRDCSASSRSRWKALNLNALRRTSRKVAMRDQALDKKMSQVAGDFDYPAILRPLDEN